MKTPPSLGLSAFICPNCRAFSEQRWFSIHANTEKDPASYDHEKISAALGQEIAKGEEADKYAIELYGALSSAVPMSLTAIVRVEPNRPSGHDFDVWNANISRCFACKREAFWIGGRLIYPTSLADVDDPNSDLPADIAHDYREAASLFVQSPRAAAALLRLAIQKLCSHVLGRAGDINEMIGELVRGGLNPNVQKALDVVRVVGNEAVHPGTMDIRDDQKIASQLFKLVNLIAEAMISTPKHIDELFQSLPENKRKGVEDRDRQRLPKA